MGTKSKKTVEVTVIDAQVINVTTKENQVLNSLISGLDAEAGFSDIDCNDLAKVTKLQVNVVKGIIGSLTQKELVFTNRTDTFGAKKQYDIVYLAPLAWNLHPTWKDEAEHNIELKIVDSEISKIDKLDIVIAKVLDISSLVKSKIKSLEKNKDEEILKSSDAPNKPYSVYGIHGKNVDLEDFIKGDIVEFKIGSELVVGEFTHFHINNWSKNGYAVLKFNGKIYERVLSSIKKVVVKKSKSSKKETLSKV